jgi:hypothetical protein
MILPISVEGPDELTADAEDPTLTHLAGFLVKGALATIPEKIPKGHREPSYNSLFSL